MFGTFRFILAIFVLLSHLDYRFYGYNPGVFAVIIFYILAGQVTSKVYILHSGSRHRAISFTKDRFLRIYPNYIAVLLTTLIFLYTTDYLNINIDIKNLLYNSTIIPLNYFFALDVATHDGSLGLNFLIPPAWSLGAEIQAYIILVIAINYQRAGLIFSYISLIIYTLANLGYIDSNIYGYRTVAGVFFCFYTGYELFLLKNEALRKTIIRHILLKIVVVALVLATGRGVFGFETSVGYILGIIFILLLGRLNLKEIYKKIDTFLGMLSYNIFISHFLVIWLVRWLTGETNQLFVILGTIFYSTIIYFTIDRPVNQLRFKKSEKLRKS